MQRRVVCLNLPFDIREALKYAETKGYYESIAWLTNQPDQAAPKFNPAMFCLG